MTPPLPSPDGLDLTSVPAVQGLALPVIGPPEAVLGRVDLRAWARALGVRTGAEVDEEVSRLRLQLIDIFEDLHHAATALADTPEPDLYQEVCRLFDQISIPAARLDSVRRAAAQYPVTDLTN